MTAMPKDPATASRLMLALGGIIVRYADFETDMLGAAQAINERRHALGHHDDAGLKLPHQSARSIKYLRQSLNLPGMELFAADIKRITAKAKEIAVVRNFIAHGTLSLFDEATQTVHFRKYRMSDDKASHCKITLAGLEARCAEIATLAAEMAGLSKRIQQALSPET